MGAKTNGTDTGPADAPAERRKIIGRRRLLETKCMVEDRSDRPMKTMVMVELNGCNDVGSKKSPPQQGTILHFLTKSHGTGWINGGGTKRDGGEGDGRTLDPKNGIRMTTLNRRLRSSTKLMKKKREGGPKSKTGKGLEKKGIVGGSDSSQPGIKKFLMGIEEHRNSPSISNTGNSPGNAPNSNKTQ